MKTALSRCTATLGLIAGLSLAFGAQAANTWTYTGVSSGSGVDTASTGATALTTTGFYATSGASESGFAANAAWTAQPLLNFSGGLGMGSDGSSDPNHAIDNDGTNTESVLLTFGASVVLTGINIGFKSGDADVSVFRYTGTSAPALAGTKASLQDMKNAGWVLVGNHGDLATDTTAPINYNLVGGASSVDAPASGANGSSWWLITAYNSSYGAATSGTVNQGNDYFKLLSVAGCASSTCARPAPEPGSLALASLALCGLAYSRRQFKRKA